MILNYFASGCSYIYKVLANRHIHLKLTIKTKISWQSTFTKSIPNIIISCDHLLCFNPWKQSLFKKIFLYHSIAFYPKIYWGMNPYRFFIKQVVGKINHFTTHKKKKKKHKKILTKQANKNMKTQLKQNQIPKIKNKDRHNHLANTNPT